MRLVGPLALLGVLALAGCGRQDLVTASGKIRIDGQAVRGGRLMLNPAGTGERAVSLVAEDGAFLLRTKGVVGAKPGAYQVTFTRPMSDEKPLSDEQNGKLRKDDLSSNELTVMYQSPTDSPVEIPASDVTDLEINIEMSRGWTRKVID